MHPTQNPDWQRTTSIFRPKRAPCFPRRFFMGLTVAGVTLSLSACATFNHIQPYPSAPGPITVSVGSAPLSKMNELPLGAFYDEPHRIVVSGHQKGVGVGMMFGLVGVLVADSANKSAAENRFGGDVTRMATDLTEITRGELAREQAERKMADTLLPGAGGQLVVTPFAVFTVNKAGNARLYAMLKAELKGTADSEPRWSVRYFARAAGEHPIAGSDSWSVTGRYAAGIKTALQRAVSALFDEMQGRYTTERKTLAKGRFAYFADDVELRVIIVHDERDFVIGRLAVGDVMVMSGTQVMDRADFTFKDADFSTPK
jgi:hypothetical protein